MDKHEDQVVSYESTGSGYKGLVVLVLLACICIVGPIYTLGSFSLGAESPLFDSLPMFAWPIVIAWGFIAMCSAWLIVGFMMYSAVTAGHPSQASQEDIRYSVRLGIGAGLNLVYFIAVFFVLDTYPSFGLWLSEALS